MASTPINLENVACPNWLPGTNEILPEGVTLSPKMKLHNALRCYCEIIKPAEIRCMEEFPRRQICKERTDRWVEQNLILRRNVVQPPPRGRLINLEP